MSCRKWGGVANGALDDERARRGCDVQRTRGAGRDATLHGGRDEDPREAVAVAVAADGGRAAHAWDSQLHGGLGGEATAVGCSCRQWERMLFSFRSAWGAGGGSQAL